MTDTGPEQFIAAMIRERAAARFHDVLRGRQGIPASGYPSGGTPATWMFPATWMELTDFADPADLAAVVATGLLREAPKKRAAKQR